MTLYQRAYSWLLGHGAVRSRLQSLLGSPAVEDNPLYRFVYGRRIRQVMGQGEAFPPRVQIEVTNRCNARCLMCPRDRLQRPLGTMSLDLCRQILDQCAEGGTREVILSGYGEPLLDRDLEERIVYAKGLGVPRVAMFSNGALLNEERARRLLATPLDVITFSVDGTSRESYERIRKGLIFDVVVANIARFRALRDQDGRRKPAIYIDMVEQRDNAGEAGGFPARWHELADYVFVEPLHSMGGVPEIAALSAAPAWWRRFPCYHLWTGMPVYWDGTVGLCCVDFNGATIMGDVSRQSVREVWASPAFQAVRASHRAGRYGDLPQCRTCTADHSWWHRL